MKTSSCFTTWPVLLTTIAFVALGCIVASAQTQTNQVRVGVYDSRAIAVAWANSSEFREAMKSVAADHKKAKEAKNDRRVKEIESRMQLQQRRAHEQGFSTGSVAPIMEKIKAQLPDIAKQADVQIIVSKWELNYHSAAIEVVDVTDRLVALFDVSERGLKWCKEIQQKPPVPLEQITEHMD